MAQNIIRKQRLEQIDSLIAQCNRYLTAMPDPFAISRVAHLDKNPCITGNYYVNAIYKEIKTEQTTNMQVLQQFKTNNTGFVDFYNINYILEVYIRVDLGMWKPYKIYGPYNNINAAYDFVKTLQNNSLKQRRRL